MTGTSTSHRDVRRPVSAKLWFLVGAAVLAALAVVAFVSLGRGSSGTRAQQLGSWATSTSFGRDVGTLEADGRHVSAAARRGLGPLHTVCAAMANDAQTFNDSLPSPDTEVTQWLARAYGLEYDAAQACYRAGSTSAAALARSSADRAEAVVLLGRAVARVEAVTGATVATTTTTVPGATSTSIF